MTDERDRRYFDEEPTARPEPTGKRRRRPLMGAIIDLAGGDGRPTTVANIEKVKMPPPGKRGPI